MKFIFLIIMMLSLSAFAENKSGYICYATGAVDVERLDQLASKLGKDYLPELGLLFIHPESCGDVHIMIYKDVCKAGPFWVTIGLAAENKLIIQGNNRISLTCEEDQITHGDPSLGGSN